MESKIEVRYYLLRSIHTAIINTEYNAKISKEVIDFDKHIYNLTIKFMLFNGFNVIFKINHSNLVSIIILFNNDIIYQYQQTENNFIDDKKNEVTRDEYALLDGILMQMYSIVDSIKYIIGKATYYK